MMQMMLTSLQVSCCLPSPLHSPQGSRPPPSAFGAVHSLVMKKGIMIVIIMMIMVIISKENYHDDCDESKKRVSSKKNTWFSPWFLRHKFCCILPTDSIHPSFQTFWMSFSNIHVYKYDLLTITSTCHPQIQNSSWFWGAVTHLRKNTQIQAQKKEKADLGSEGHMPSWWSQSTQGQSQVVSAMSYTGSYQ